MGTTLKQCCDIALVYGKNLNLFPTVQSAELKSLIQLIESNWKFDVSSQAASDLKVNVEFSKLQVNTRDEKDSLYCWEQYAAVCYY